MTHNLKKDDQSFILTIYVKGLWSLIFFITKDPWQIEALIILFQINQFVKDLWLQKN